jgi:outer membrane cobalamin receptor
MKIKSFLLPVLLIVLLSSTSFAEEISDPKYLLELSLQDLLNLKVSTAGKREEKVSDIPASVVIITRQEIAQNGYMTLQEVLENVPGLYLIDNYALSDVTIGVRGFWAPFTRNVIILVNGVSQKRDFESDYPLDKIGVPVEAIDRIEVIRGPMSVIYGSGGFFGAINIITNDVHTAEKSSVISASYGTEQTRKIFLRTMDSGENHYIVFNGSLYETEGMDIPFSEMTSTPEAYGDADETTGGLLDVTQKYFNFSGGFNDFYMDFSFVETDDPMYFTSLITSEKYGKNRKATNISLGYRHEFSPKLSLDAKFGHYQCNTRAEILGPYMGDNPYGIHESHSSSYDLELDVFATPMPKLNITFGLYYRRILGYYEEDYLPTTGYHNTFFDIPEDNPFYQSAVFTQIDYAPLNKLRLVAGLRLESVASTEENVYWFPGLENEYVENFQYEKPDISVIPRFAMVYDFDRKNIIKLLYGKGIKIPTLAENTTSGEGSGSLESEEIQTVEVNYSSAITSKFSTTISLYYNMLDNLIYRNTWFDDEEYKSSISNEGKMNTTGVEFTLQTQPTDRLNAGFSISYQNTEDQRHEDWDVAFSPDVLGYFDVVYHFPKNVSFAVTGNYVDEMESMWVVEPGFPEGHRLGEKTEAYLNLGANIRVEDIWVEGTILNFHGSNLLDEPIRYPTYGSSRWADKGTAGIQRKFLATLGWKF